MSGGGMKAAATVLFALFALALFAARRGASESASGARE